ncbi:MAG TPA: hypothetical protein VF292_07375 [Rhodanobacteraceae bacterium]
MRIPRISPLWRKIGLTIHLAMAVAGSFVAHVDPSIGDALSTAGIVVVGVLLWWPSG